MNKCLIQIGAFQYVMDNDFMEGMTDARQAFYNPNVGMSDYSEASSGRFDSYKRGFKLQTLLMSIEIIT